MDTLPIGTEIDPLGRLIMGGFAQDRDNESRAVRLSTLERRIVKQPNICIQCQNNNDPNNVPVHPNCDCDVVTDSIETGTLDTGHPLLNVLNKRIADIVIQGVDHTPEDIAVQMLPETVAVLDENVRWADLARWLEQMQPYLEQTGQYLSIVVDEDTDEAIANVEDILELASTDAEAAVDALKDKKFILSIAKVVLT